MDPSLGNERISQLGIGELRAFNRAGHADGLGLASDTVNHGPRDGLTALVLARNKARRNTADQGMRDGELQGGRVNRDMGPGLLRKREAVPKGRGWLLLAFLVMPTSTYTWA